MSRIGRNAMLFVVIMLAWVFFFVPNPVFSFLNIQQLQTRLPNWILFGFVPLMLALVSMFATAGTLATRIILTLCVPVLGATGCLALWASGAYSDESLVGAWLFALPPIAAYLLGTVTATVLLRRKNMPWSNTHAAMS